jgi:hypothetical protein
MMIQNEGVLIPRRPVTLDSQAANKRLLPARTAGPP